MKIIDNFLYPDDFEYLRKYVLDSNQTPYYLQPSTCGEDRVKYFNHTIVARPEQEPFLKENGLGFIRNEQLYEIVKDIIKHSGETYSKILRASINLTFRDKVDRQIDWHYDHEDIDYKHILLYLTAHDDASTYIQEENGDEIEVSAFANRVILFGKELHRSTLPRHGIRAVLVITYI